VERQESIQAGNREVQPRAEWGVGEVHSSKEASNDRGAKGPQFKFHAEAARAWEIGVSLTSPIKVRQLQRALYAKAKANPTYRFYALYDKIYRKDVLLWAWSCCRANGGSAGVDGQSFEEIESRGVEGWVEQLAKELKEKTYRPQAVRRVMIPKPEGKQRPLGIPTN
jgi:hypothetical protein